MIVDFTITNFRSIKESQTFSMFAPSSSHLSSNVSYLQDKKLGVLRTAGIYGANASGKSNLLTAFRALRWMVRFSGGLKDGEKIPCYEPFKLSKVSASAPVSFELEFIVDDVRYIYYLSYSSHRIVEERLEFYPSRQKAVLFSKEKDETWETMNLGKFLKGKRRKFALFENNSYLSKAGDSADSPELIRDVYRFLGERIINIGLDDDFRLASALTDEDVRLAASSLLMNIDTGISDVKLETLDPSALPLPDSLPEEIREQIIKRSKHKLIFFHENDVGDVEQFSEGMESSGTLKILNMLPMLILCFARQYILIVDELDNSLHPHIAELIIRLFNDPDVNKVNSQLIFSTHNIHLMSSKFLRRDQIWLSEKSSGVTSFTSLEEFDKRVVRPDSPFYRWYYEGRFGGVPKFDYSKITEILSRLEG